MVPVAVSVLMTVYNGERTIARALDSVIRQDFELDRAYEIVVVNDGSTDQTQIILSRYAKAFPMVRVISLERVGRARALNAGLRACRAPYVAINDADDLSLSRRLREQLAYMEANPGVVLVSGWARVVGDSGELLEERRLIDDHQRLRRRLALGNPFIHSTIMYRKSALERIGGFDEKRLAAIDYDAIERLARIGRLAVVQSFIVTHYRGKEQFFRSRINPSVRFRSAAEVSLRAAIHHAKFFLPLSLVVYGLANIPWSGQLWKRVSPVYSKLLAK